jgi:Tfp pilus assembly protein PilV
MKYSNTSWHSSGQALVESLVTLGLVVVLVTGLLSLTAKSLSAGQFSKYKSTAVGYASDALEIVRKERDTGWFAFYAKATGGGNTWCLSDTGVWTAAVGSCPVNVNSFYIRSVTYTTSGATKVIIDATVSWADGSTTHSTALRTYLTQWK